MKKKFFYRDCKMRNTLHILNLSLKYFLSIGMTLPTLGRTEPSAALPKNAIPLAVVDPSMRTEIKSDILFDVNDVSYLWPVPRNSNDLKFMISGDDVLALRNREPSNHDSGGDSHDRKRRDDKTDRKNNGRREKKEREKKEREKKEKENNSGNDSQNNGNDNENKIGQKQIFPEFVLQSLLNYGLGKIDQKGDPTTKDTPELDKIHTRISLPFGEDEDGKTNDSIFNVKNWKVVGFRFDHCAPNAALMLQDINECSVNLRLIVQPILVNKDRIKVLDFTTHLVYSFKGKNKLNRAKDIIIALQSLKKVSERIGVKTNGVALGEHPGLKIEADKNNENRPFTNEVKRFVLSQLVEANLEEVAFMGIKDPEPWMFYSALIKGNKVEIFQNPILGLKDPNQQALGFNTAQALNFRSFPLHVIPTPELFSFSKKINKEVAKGNMTEDLIGSIVSSKNKFKPESSQPIRLGTFKLIDDTEDKKDFRTPKVSQEIADGIANPTRSHFFNSDCVSCHTESTTRIRMFDFNSSSPLSDRVNAGRFQTPKGVTGYSKNLPRSSWNVRNFGYFHEGSDGGAVAVVSQRAVNETAVVAASINLSWIKGATLDDVRRAVGTPESLTFGPGKNCRDGSEDLDNKVYTCFMESKIKGKSTDDCLRDCSDIN